jgi:hypothetical protein
LTGYGPGLPGALKAWLKDPDTGKLRRNKQTSVSLGPNNGFIAWDSSSIRWKDIPATLEEKLQEWLSPAGWIHGPPRQIALGLNNSWFAISEYGMWSYNAIPDSMCEEFKQFRTENTSLTSEDIVVRSKLHL